MSMSSELAAGIEDNDLHFGDRNLRPTAKNNKSNIEGNAEEITTMQRMISASLGSFLTSLVVTPFDVVRIRIQQQEILPSNKVCCNAKANNVLPDGNGRNTLAKISASKALDMGEAAKLNIPRVPSSSAPAAANAIAASGNPLQALAADSPELFWINGGYCQSAENCSRINSTFQGFVNISRNEGLVTLWRGLSLTLFMAIPSNIIYFTGYEYIRDHSPIAYHPLNPLLCGAFARIMAATFVSPIELIKTRLQSIPSDLKDGSSNSKILKTLLHDSYKLVNQRGIGTLFTGLKITLWRDVPFSGIYWSCYEFIKERLSLALQVDFNNEKIKSQNEDWKVFATSFLSGSTSGAIAALFTNPFDVGKTRLQITTQEAHSKGEKLKRPSMFRFLYKIYRNEGISALYSGFGPRLMKIAPSCAIMISSYEIGKKFFKNGNTEASQ